LALNESRGRLENRDMQFFSIIILFSTLIEAHVKCPKKQKKLASPLPVDPIPHSLSSYSPGASVVCSICLPEGGDYVPLTQECHTTKHTHEPVDPIPHSLSSYSPGGVLFLTT